MHPTSIRLALTCCAVLLPGIALATEEASFTPPQLEFFEKQVRPLLAEHCYGCHSVEADKQRGGLRLDSRRALVDGGDSGPAIVPGDPEGSLLIEAVHYESYEMPPAGKLSDDAIATLERWVAEGAAWPVEAEPTADSTQSVFSIEQRKAEHWVWQPVRDPELPPVQEPAWGRSPIDQFTLAGMEAAGLQPTGDASPEQLVRRLYFDLVGLPPSPQQVAAVVDDPSPDRMERLVDRLLDSPRFGERWGRHWLDLVRYAESRGHEFDEDARNAYQYRDYVIRGLNADVPYDQWVREHLAGDLLDEPRLHPEQGFNESVLGTGFWFLGEWVHSPVDIYKDESDRFDNMIDVMSKTFLGVTVACARCHDHKFDAISTADYYALTGYLQSSDYRQVRFESIEANRKIAQQVADLDARMSQQFAAAVARATSANASASGDDDAGIAAWQDPKIADHPACVVDYAATESPFWVQDGYSFGAAPVQAADFAIAETPENGLPRVVQHSAAVNDPFWFGLESISERGVHQRNRLAKIARSGRTLRSPTFRVTSPQVHCLVRGKGHVVACVDSHRLVAGPLHGETIRHVDGKQTWVTLSLGRYLGHDVHLEFTPDPGQVLEVETVYQGDDPELRQRILERRQRMVAAAKRRQEMLATALEDPAVAGTLRELTARWHQARQALKGQVVRRSRLAMAMMDGSSEEGTILIRGSASNPGPVEPRHFLTAISGDTAPRFETRSGRLELAAEINDPANPLTHRVIVNRVWKHLMGRGIVPTTDDFGALGQRPTHPELLDHLAMQFRRDGQSLKQLIRYIVRSRTYQLDSRPADPATQRIDPKNQWLSYRSLKRLEGEAIRDTLLQLAGKLDPQMYGEPVPIHLTSFMEGRGRPGMNGPRDGKGRRSIYIAVRRNFLSPFMLAFDTPVPFSTMGRRNVSNVPAQALILMNDPLVREAAAGWAERVCAEIPGESPGMVERRVGRFLRAAFARPPLAAERAAAMQFVRQQAASQGQPVAAAAVWGELAHALINTKEFIYIR